VGWPLFMASGSGRKYLPSFDLLSQSCDDLGLLLIADVSVEGSTDVQNVKVDTLVCRPVRGEGRAFMVYQCLETTKKPRKKG